MMNGEQHEQEHWEEGDDYGEEEYYDEYDEEYDNYEPPSDFDEGHGDNVEPHYTEALKENSSESMNSLTRRKLSKVSAAYDTGGKGFLTPAEESLRRLDVKGEGKLSNAAVAQLMESKMHGDEIIRRLSRLLWLLLGMTLLLILANLGTAWAVAIMAKDTTIDLSSGEMYVKSKDGDQHQLVTTRTSGDTFVFFNFNVSAKSVFIDQDEIEKESDSFFAALTEDGDNSAEEEEEEKDDSLFCITPENAAKIWHDASTGTAVTALLDFTSQIDYEQATTIEEVPIDLRSLSLQSDGAMMNETHVCLGAGQTSSGKPSFLCIDFVSPLCDPDNENQEEQQQNQDSDISSSISRSSNADNDRPGSRRQLFHRALQGLQGNDSFDQQGPAAKKYLRSRQLDTSQGTSNCGKKCQRRRKRKKNRSIALSTQPNSDNSVIVQVSRSQFTSGLTGVSQVSTMENGRRPINRLPTTFNRFHCQAFGKCGAPSGPSNFRNPIQAAPASSFTQVFTGGSGTSDIGRSQTQPGSTGTSIQNQAFGNGSSASNAGRSQEEPVSTGSQFTNQAFGNGSQGGASNAGRSQEEPVSTGSQFTNQAFP